MTAAVPDLPPRRPTVVTRDAARRIHWLGGTQTVYDTGGTSGGAFSLSKDEVPPGGGPVWHRHSRETEVFVVRGGACEFFAPTADGPGRPARVEAGGMIALPPGVPHRFTNVSDRPAPVLTLMAPGGNGQFFVDLSAPADAPEDPTDPPDPEAFARVGRRYGITMFGPDDVVGERMPDEILPLAGGAVPVVRQAGEGERLAVGDAALTLKFTAADTGGRLTVAEAALPPGGVAAGRPPRGLRRGPVQRRRRPADAHLVGRRGAGRGGRPAGGLRRGPVGHGVPPAQRGAGGGAGADALGSGGDRTLLAGRRRGRPRRRRAGLGRGGGPEPVRLRPPVSRDRSRRSRRPSAPPAARSGPSRPRRNGRPGGTPYRRRAA